jgi:hypothetical protein
MELVALQSSFKNVIKSLAISWEKGAVTTISFDMPVISVITGEIVVMGFMSVQKVATLLFTITLLLSTNTAHISMIHY